MTRLSLLAHGGCQIAEITGEDRAITSIKMIAGLMDEAVSLQADRLLANRGLIDESFFDVKSGFADQLVQKLKATNLRLAVTGEFNWVETLALKAYIKKHGIEKQVFFAKAREAALDWLSQGSAKAVQAKAIISSSERPGSRAAWFR